ncbi:WD repeat-containing protein 93 isoform X7 [Trachinotus anak]|uniref:WD repeat-containing protein 93 isoform X7 n=1 Tax=Trachinotus anak TaxID=443729 RepID=UPI0039F16CB7
MEAACKEAEKSRWETLEPSVATELPESTNCLSFSEDGRYLSLGHSQGLSVWCASSLTCVADWLEDRLEITSIQMNRMAEMAYLLGTIDDMGTALEGPDEVQMTDFLTNYLAVDIVTKSCRLDKHSVNTDEEKTKETNKSPRCCTQHFLLPCGQFPGDSKAKSQPAEFPVAVCVWWSGSHNLFQYFLQKAPKSKPDVEPMPDLLWPNAKEILCSAVSRCTRYIALGLENALVCVWDRQSGSPLSVVLISATDSALCRMQFVDYRPVSTDDSQTFTTAEVHLLVACKSGALHTITTGRGTQSCTMLLTERLLEPKDSGDLPTITESVPFLQGLFLQVQRNGKMFLQDVINKQTVCCLILPKTHPIATPCNPVYALNSKQQTLLIRGDQDPSYRASSKEDSQSQLFIFHFGESDILKQYIVSAPYSPQQQKTLSFVTLEETCNLYLQQRALCADERNKAITQTWTQLQETATMAQQGHHRAAAS